MPTPNEIGPDCRPVLQGAGMCVWLAPRGLGGTGEQCCSHRLDLSRKDADTGSLRPCSMRPVFVDVTSSVPVSVPVLHF